MNNRIKVIELLKRSENEAQCCTSSAYWKAVNTKLFDQAIALLEQPTPDCQRPEAGKLSVELRKVANYKLGVAVPLPDELWNTPALLRQAAEVLDRQAGEIKQWKARYEDITGGMMKRQIELIQELIHQTTKNEQLKTAFRLIKEYTPRIDEKASSNFLLADIQLIAKQVLDE